MPRGRQSEKNLITEHAGFKLGDKVHLISPATPDTVGTITKIFMDRLMGKGEEEIAFVVSIQNPDDNNVVQDWTPMYAHELKHVGAK